MNAQAREEFPAIEDKDWTILGYMDKAKPTGPKLDNETLVHNLFNYRNDNRPSGKKEIWILEEGQSWENLQHVMLSFLRLATKILTSPDSIRFLYYIFYGRRVELPELSKQAGMPVRSFHPTDNSTSFEQMYQRVDRVLNRLALSVQFSFSSESTDERMETARAATSPLLVDDKFERVNILQDGRRHGIAGLVHVNDRHFAVMTDLLWDSEKNYIEILTAEFMMAKALVHEVYHLAYMATSPDYIMWANRVNAKHHYGTDATVPPPVEPLFQDEGIPEIGDSGDNFLYGGRIEWDWTTPHSAPTFYKFPSFLYPDRYLRKPGPKRTATRFIVPKPFLQNIQQRGFWESLRPGQTRALRIAKIVGVNYTYQGEDLDKEWHSSSSSEGAWPTTSPYSSRVYREERDPSSAGINRPYDPPILAQYQKMQGSSH